MRNLFARSHVGHHHREHENVAELVDATVHHLLCPDELPIFHEAGRIVTPHGGGEVALGVITALTIAFVPAGLLGLEVMLNALQALIFSILTSGGSPSTRTAINDIAKAIINNNK